MMFFPLWWTCDLKVEVHQSFTKYGSNEPDLVNMLTDSVQESVNAWVDSKPAVKSVERFPLDNGRVLVLKRQNEDSVDACSCCGQVDESEYYFRFELERGQGNLAVPLPLFFLYHPHLLVFADMAHLQRAAASVNFHPSSATTS